MTDLDFVDRLIFSPSYDLVKSVEEFMTCQLDQLVTDPFHDLVKSVEEYTTYSSTDVF